MRLRLTLLAPAAVSLAACASSERSAPLAIDPQLAPRARVVALQISGERRRADEGFGRLGVAVMQRLGGCARGPQPLRLRLQIARVERSWRRPHAEPGLEVATAELIDSRSGVVVGRYPLGFRLAAGSPDAETADWQQSAGGEVGAAVCWRAFGRR